jgi:hypothetical protein
MLDGKCKRILTTALIIVVGQLKNNNFIVHAQLEGTVLCLFLQA